MRTITTILNRPQHGFLASKARHTTSYTYHQTPSITTVTIVKHTHLGKNVSPMNADDNNGTRDIMPPVKSMSFDWNTLNIEAYYIGKSIILFTMLY